MEPLIESKRPYTVVLEGNIASGKTSFLSYFKKHPSIFTLPEPISKWKNFRDCNMLDLVYKNPKRWAFTFQMLVYKTMLDNHLKYSKDCAVKMMERSIFSAKYMFIENYYRTKILSETEHNLLNDWYEFILSNFPIKCDLIVYLKTTPDVALERVRKRGCSEEKDIDLEYLKDLNNLMDELLFNKTNFNHIPIVSLNGDASQECVLKEFLQTKEYKQIHNSVSL